MFEMEIGETVLTAAITLSLLGSLGLYHDVRADFLEDMEKKYPDAITAYK